MIEEGLQARIAAAVEHDRVYPLTMPQDPTYPAVTFGRVSAARHLESTGPSGFVAARFQVDAYAESYAAAIIQAQSIRGTLDGVRGTWGDTVVAVSALDGERIEFESETALYRVSLDFTIHYQE